MTRNEIVEQVNGLLADEFEVDAALFTPEANVRDLVALIQQTYKIKIPVAELRGIQTFTDLYDYIESHLAAGGN